MESSAVLQEIQYVLQVCGIFECIAHTRLIDNKGFNSLEDFNVMDGDMEVLDMAKSLVSRAVTTRMNLGTVQIKGLQYLVWCINDCLKHNHLLIAAAFDQVAKRAVDDGETDREGEVRYRRKGERSR